MKIDGEEIIPISNKEDLNILINRIQNGSPFAYAFQFKNEKYIQHLFSSINISTDEFNEKNYYFDKNKELHISASSDGYLWISTQGLIGQKNMTENQYVNSFFSQHCVVTLLLNHTIEMCAKESIYDINSPLYSEISELTPSIFQNIIFYFELFGKAYLSICNQKVPKTHKLSDIVKLVRQTMFDNNHNDTLFHAIIYPSFENTVNYLQKIHGEFKEQFVKYNDNKSDTTVIPLDQELLKEYHDSIIYCEDFILDYYYCDGNSIYLQQGQFDRFLAKAVNENDRQIIANQFADLAAKE